MLVSSLLKSLVFEVQQCRKYSLIFLLFFLCVLPKKSPPTLLFFALRFLNILLYEYTLELVDGRQVGC